MSHANNRTLVYEGAMLEQINSAETSEREDYDTDIELDDFEDDPLLTHLARTGRSWKRTFGQRRRRGSGRSRFILHAPRRRRSLLCRAVQAAYLVALLIPALILATGIFFPSYSYPPQRYLDLRDRVQEQGQTANIHKEKVFIAASLYDPDGELLSGAWARSVAQLVRILGQENVFLSIYEDDPTERAQAALDQFAQNVTCGKEFFTEKMDKDGLPRVSTPHGDVRLKRIEFLATVRNRALKPLEDSRSIAYNQSFDKLLYLNDVVFDPVDAANLLFSTNADEKTGRTHYRAACAVDFINPMKFYDTFATRDTEGYNMGVPFYPWFTGAGEAASRNDVLQQKDAVRVKSCWGGMVAFEAKWFQTHLHRELHDSGSTVTTQATKDHTSGFKTDIRAWEEPQEVIPPLRFRAEADTYWDSSECCLIHADLSAMDPESLAFNETGIYMNPYIRVSYDEWVLPWLSFTKRFERLYTPIHTIVNWIAGRPSSNERQFQRPGEEVTDKVWMWDQDALPKLQNGGVQLASDLQGRFHEVHRTARAGGFCGARQLAYLNEHPENGERKWTSEKLPTLPVH